ncbi:unnamed protein product [Closterium sp. NIES-64]|nr:unnamed protein product [Closterium sp. NIES-64]CAI6009740.1 unnamed protein product [Closterium sp. NIES-65]
MPLLFLLLLLLPLPHSTAASHGSGGAAARLNGLAEDPLADDDSFARLAEADKRRWAQGAAEDAGLAAKMRRLAEVEVVTRVHVRLVGFDGDRDDNSNLRVQPEEMTKFLNTLKPDNVFRAIHGEVWHSRREPHAPPAFPPPRHPLCPSMPCVLSLSAAAPRTPRWPSPPLAPLAGLLRPSHPSLAFSAPQTPPCCHRFSFHTPAPPHSSSPHSVTRAGSAAARGVLSVACAQAPGLCHLR